MPTVLTDAHAQLDRLLTLAAAEDWDAISLEGAQYIATLEALTPLSTDERARESVRELLQAHIELARGIEARLTDLAEQLGHNQKARRVNAAYHR